MSCAQPVARTPFTTITGSRPGMSVPTEQLKLSRFLRTCLPALATGLVLTTAAAARDPEAGAAVFRKCQACHALGEGAQNRVGPQLNDLFGRTAGGLE